MSERFTVYETPYDAHKRLIEQQQEIERLEKLADINADEIQEYQQEIERLQSMIGMEIDERCALDGCKRQEIERLRADVKLLSVAAQRADNIEKHRDELQELIDNDSESPDRTE